MKSSLQYLNIEPAKELKANSEQAPEVEGKTVEEAKAELKKSGFEAIVLGKKRQGAETSSRKYVQFA